MGGGFLHVAQRDPGVQCGGDECVPQRVRPDVLGDPGAAGNPADDPPGAVPVQPAPLCGQEDGSFVAFADGQVDRPGGAGCERDGNDLAALRVITRVRCPRSTPRASISAPVASETRSPLRASREISACSAGGPSPAATSSAPSSLRSSPWRGTRNPGGDGGRARRVSGRGVPLLRRSDRTRRWCTAAG